MLFLQYFKRSSEVAFNSEHKYMSVTGVLSTAVPAQETTYLKGALEVVLEKCSSYSGPEGKLPPMDDSTRKRISNAAHELSDRGLRVLATAYGSPGAADSNTLTFCGLQAMQDPPRPGVKDAIASLAKGGAQVVMITGDAESTAVSIARELGIIKVAGSTGVMTGRQLDTLSQRQLQERITSVSVFARTTPRHKMAIISAFQANGAVVAMTGDGGKHASIGFFFFGLRLTRLALVELTVNDAPALKMADIGISMGKSGTDVAKEAADVILVDDNFSTILPAVEEGAPFHASGLSFCILIAAVFWPFFSVQENPSSTTSKTSLPSSSARPLQP